MSKRGVSRRNVILVILVVSALPWGCNEILYSLFPWLRPSGCQSNCVVVNLQIDAEQETGSAGIQKIVDELKARNIKATVFVTGEYANRQALTLNSFSRDGFEIAMHGYNTGEQLASMTYAEQKDLLSRALTALQGCQSCGTGTTVVGFRPQYFSQNEDTYRILDELGLTYDGGYKAGQLCTDGAACADGHQNDVTPYAVAGHNFKAVPITTVEYGGKRVYLCDIASAQAEHYTAAQWAEVLQAGFEQARDNDQPLVVLFHGWYTGDSTQYDYWQPFVDFLNNIQDSSTFLTTQELVARYSN